MRMGEEIPEGDWERFSRLDLELTETARRLADAVRGSDAPGADAAGDSERQAPTEEV
jgi:hypothetical protein